MIEQVQQEGSDWDTLMATAQKEVEVKLAERLGDEGARDAAAGHLEMAIKMARNTIERYSSTIQIAGQPQQLPDEYADDPAMQNLVEKNANGLSEAATNARDDVAKHSLVVCGVSEDTATKLYRLLLMEASEGEK